MTRVPLGKVVELHEVDPTAMSIQHQWSYVKATFSEQVPKAVTVNCPPTVVNMAPGTPPWALPSATAALYMSSSMMPVSSGQVCVAVHWTATFVTLAPEMVPLPFVSVQVVGVPPLVPLTVTE